MPLAKEDQLELRRMLGLSDESDSYFLKAIEEGSLASAFNVYQYQRWSASPSEQKGVQVERKQFFASEITEHLTAQLPTEVAIGDDCDLAALTTEEEFNAFIAAQVKKESNERFISILLTDEHLQRSTLIIDRKNENKTYYFNARPSEAGVDRQVAAFCHQDTNPHDLKLLFSPDLETSGMWHIEATLALTYFLSESTNSLVESTKQWFRQEGHFDAVKHLQETLILHGEHKKSLLTLDEGVELEKTDAALLLQELSGDELFIFLLEDISSALNEEFDLNSEHIANELERRIHELEEQGHHHEAHQLEKRLQQQEHLIQIFSSISIALSGVSVAGGFYRQLRANDEERLTKLMNNIVTPVVSGGGGTVASLGVLGIVNLGLYTVPIALAASAGIKIVKATVELGTANEKMARYKAMHEERMTELGEKINEYLNINLPSHYHALNFSTDEFQKNPNNYFHENKKTEAANPQCRQAVCALLVARQQCLKLIHKQMHEVQEERQEVLSELLTESYIGGAAILITTAGAMTFQGISTGILGTVAAALTGPVSLGFIAALAADYLLEALPKIDWLIYQSWLTLGRMAEEESGLTAIASRTLQIMLTPLRLLTALLKPISGLYTHPHQRIQQLAQSGLVGLILVFPAILLATALLAVRATATLARTLFATLGTTLYVGGSLISHGVRSALGLFNKNWAPKEPLSSKLRAYGKLYQHIGHNIADLWHRVNQPVKQETKPQNLASLVKNWWQSSPDELQQDRAKQDEILTNHTATPEAVAKRHLEKYIAAKENTQDDKYKTAEKIKSIMEGEGTCNKLLALHQLEHNTYGLTDKKKQRKQSASWFAKLGRYWRGDGSRHIIHSSWLGSSKLLAAFSHCKASVLHQASQSQLQEILQYKLGVLVPDENKRNQMVSALNSLDLGEKRIKEQRVQFKKITKSMSFADKEKFKALMQACNLLSTFDSSEESCRDSMAKLTTLMQRSEINRSTLNVSETQQLLRYVHVFMQEKLKAHLHSQPEDKKPAFSAEHFLQKQAEDAKEGLKPAVTFSKALTNQFRATTKSSQGRPRSGSRLG